MPIIGDPIPGQAPKQLEREETLNLFHDLLDDHQKQLTQFPAKGKKYFELPEVSTDIKAKYQKLNQEQVSNLISVWVTQECHLDLRSTYGYRAVGHMLKSLAEEKKEMVAAAFQQYSPQLSKQSGDDFRDQFARLTEIYYASVEAQDYFGHHIDWGYYEETRLDQKLSTHAERIAMCNLFKSGIITEDFEYYYERHNLRGLVDADLINPLKEYLAWLGEETASADNKEMKTMTTALLVVAQAKGGEEIDKQALEYLLKENPNDLKLLLCYPYASRKESEMPGQISQIIGDHFEPNTGHLVELLSQLIVEGTKINKDSRFFKELKNAKLTPGDIDDLCVVVKTAIDTYEGDWQKLDPQVRELVEENFKKGKISLFGFTTLISPFVGFGIEFPPFLKSYFSDESNLQVLKNWLFNFEPTRELDKYDYSDYYHYAPRNYFLAQGFSVFPEEIRNTYKNNPDLVSEAAKQNILNQIFYGGYLSNYFLDSRDYPPRDKKGEQLIDEYDGRFYKFVSKDIWDVLATAQIQTFIHNFELNPSIVTEGISISYYDSEYNFHEVKKPLVSFFPPELLEELRHKIFPDSRVTQQSINDLKSLRFVLTDEVDKSFSTTDQNFLRFYKRFPAAAAVLFSNKDTIFAEERKETEYITGDLLSILHRQEAHYEIEVLIGEYIDKTEDELDFDLLKMATGWKCFPKDKLSTYLSFSPEKENLYQQLNRESRQGEWANLVSNPDQFWANNNDLFLSLIEAGFTDLTFRVFRSITGNSEVVELLRERALSTEDLSIFRGSLGLTAKNLSYINLETLTLLHPLLLTDAEIDDATKLNADKKLDFYRQLLAGNPGAFKNAVLSISRSPDVDITDSKVQSRIKSVIAQIGNISPMVLKHYVEEDDVVERAKFVEKIKIIRERLLKNQPVKEILAEYGYSNDVLAELITLSFPLTDLVTVARQLVQINDRCDDLAAFTIRQDGYEGKSTIEVKVASLKKGETLDLEFLDGLAQMFPRRIDKAKRGEYKKQFEKSLNLVLKRAGAFTYDEVKDNLLAILSILYEDESVREFRKTSFDFSQEENVSVFLSRVTELLGIYFKDNFEQKLAEIISSNEQLKGRLVRLLTPKRINQTVRNLSAIPEKARARLQQLTDNISQASQASQEIDSEDLSGLISLIIENRILRGPKALRTKIRKEAKKFEYKTMEGREAIQEDLSFRGHVSKNAASFFAKTTAGVCTAGDINLFNRPDHFHINLVREDKVVGNIQGYVFEHEGKRALLFRGFNPSSSFVNQTNAEFICSGMMNIVKQFAQDNNIENIFITEQTGWHALTNRVGEGVYAFFKRRYIKPENEIEFPYAVTEKVTVNRIYRVR